MFDGEKIIIFLLMSGCWVCVCVRLLALYATEPYPKKQITIPKEDLEESFLFFLLLIWNVNYNCNKILLVCGKGQ